VEGEFRIDFKPNQTQRSFIQSQAQADFFSTRVGEGKSTALNWACLYHTIHNPGARWAMIRDTWENLRRTTLASFFERFPPGVMGTWHESNKEWTWASGIASGKIIWLGMDDPKDASKLQSLELAGFGMDEVAPAEGSGGIPELVFDLALTRLRQSGANWYAAKLASNNSDDTHWSHRRFVDPGSPGFVLWQPQAAENEKNLPPGYYETLRRQLGHRADLISRFIDGQFGFQQIGSAVTPQFNEKIHLATGLAPVRGADLVLLWDFGLNPTCIITQVTPLGHWLILQSIVGDGIGVQELIAEVVKPLLQSRYFGFRWRHIGDPNGVMREQSSSRQSAVRVIRTELGGTFRAGPVSFSERVEPLRAVLSRTLQGRAVVQVDRSRAREVHLSLRGGWHFRESATGVYSPDPVKDMHSHPGDAMGYGAARLFPMGRLLRPGRQVASKAATFFGGQTTASKPVIPREMRELFKETH
jgi:hypothetical protein